MPTVNSTSKNERNFSSKCLAVSRCLFSPIPMWNNKGADFTLFLLKHVWVFCLETRWNVFAHLCWWWCVKSWVLSFLEAGAHSDEGLSLLVNAGTPILPTASWKLFAVFWILRRKEPIQIWSTGSWLSSPHPKTAGRWAESSLGDPLTPG